MRDYSVLFRGMLGQSIAKLLALALATALTLTIAGSVTVSRAYAADALGDQQVQQVGQQVLAGLQQVDFRDKAIRDKLAKTNFTAAEKLNKKVAIWKDNKDKYPTLNDVPDEVVLQALQEEYLLASDMEGAFNQIKKDLPTILPLMLKADSQVAAAGKNKDVTYYVNAIKNDTAGFLIGAAYLQRNYGFNIKEGATVARQLMTENNAFGKEYAPLDIVKTIGQQNADQRKMLSTPKLFKEVLGGKIADQTDLGTFLNDQVTKTGQKPADWFWKTSKAVIFEKKSKANPTAPYRVFDKLKSEPNGQAELLALLNVSENSLYVASTVESIMYGLTDTYVNRALKDADPDAYHAELEAFENKVEYAAERQADYLDFWYRLAKEDKRA
ncbi:ZmpA/ZmpB/ZmpC family metallo-endopeptidase, partial [Varibaculum cambriense]